MEIVATPCNESYCFTGRRDLRRPDDSLSLGSAKGSGLSLGEDVQPEENFDAPEDRIRAETASLSSDQSLLLRLILDEGTSQDSALGIAPSFELYARVPMCALQGEDWTILPQHTSFANPSGTEGQNHRFSNVEQPPFAKRDPSAFA